MSVFVFLSFLFFGEWSRMLRVSVASRVFIEDLFTMNEQKEGGVNFFVGLVHCYTVEPTYNNTSSNSIVNLSMFSVVK